MTLRRSLSRWIYLNTQKSGCHMSVSSKSHQGKEQEEEGMEEKEKGSCLRYPLCYSEEREYTWIPEHSPGINLRYLPFSFPSIPSLVAFTWYCYVKPSLMCIHTRRIDKDLLECQNISRFSYICLFYPERNYFFQ